MCGIAEQGVCKSIAETSGVGQELSQRNRTLLFGEDQFVILLGNTVQDLYVLNLRQMVVHWFVEREEAFLDKLHSCDGCDRFGHRGDSEYRIRFDAAGGVGQAMCSRINNFIRARRHGDHVGETTRFNCLFQYCVCFLLSTIHRIDAFRSGV